MSKLKKVLRWIGRRAKEPTSWVGAAVLATVLGKPELAAQIGEYGKIAGVVLGTGLVAAPQDIES